DAVSQSRYPGAPGVACMIGVAWDIGSGHTRRLASQTVTLVGKFSPPMILTGADGWPFGKLTLKTPPPPSIVPQPFMPQVNPMSTKKTSPVGLTATPNGLTPARGMGPFALVRWPASSNQLTAVPPNALERTLVTAQQLVVAVLQVGSRAMPAGKPPTAPTNTVYGALGTSSPSGPQSCGPLGNDAWSNRITRALPDSGT